MKITRWVACKYFLSLNPSVPSLQNKLFLETLTDSLMPIKFYQHNMRSVNRVAGAAVVWKLVFKMVSSKRMES